VEYWWTVTDAVGGRVETEPVRVRFDDNRYSWRSLTEGNLNLYWYEGDEAFAGELMAAARQALVRLEEDTGAHLEKPVNIYIYADSQDLVGAMIYPQEWTGGVAYTHHGVIALGVSSDDLLWGVRAMAHELAHLVVHQMTYNPYGGLPTWLDEGLAMYAEGPPNLAFTTPLYKAIEADSLISVRSLSSAFSAFADEAVLAYAQSHSLVVFLVESYGQSQMLELLDTFRQGSGYDEALEEVYGFDMDGLEARWRDYMGISAPAGAEG
jgi:hypothetical protein